MKKALVVFLILAVAGGLFAQLSFSGSVSTGFGIGFDDTDMKPLVDYIRDRGDQGLRADINFNYTGGGPDKDGNPNPYGSWGAGLGVRGQVDKFATSTYAISINGGSLWWRPNTLAYIQLGSGGPNNYGTPGGLGSNQSIGDNAGLKLELTPLGNNNLRIGAHAFYGNVGALKNFEDMNYGLGVNFTQPSLLNVVANFRYKAEQEKNKFDVNAGANFLGLSSVGLTKLAADFGTRNFGASNAYLGIGESITFKALENLLTLDLSGQQFIWNGDGTKEFIPMRYRAGLSYVIDKITPAIQVQYSMGATPSFNYRNANEVGGVDSDASFDKKDNVALGVSPQVTFNFGPTLVIGYNLQMDMSSPAPASGTRSLQHLIYGTVNISF